MAKKTAPKTAIKPTQKSKGTTQKQSTLKQKVTSNIPPIDKIRLVDFNSLPPAFQKQLMEKLEGAFVKEESCNKAEVLSHKTDSSQMISTNSPVSNKPALESLVDRLSNSNSYTRNLMHNLCNAIDRITGTNANVNGSGNTKEQAISLSLLGKFSEELHFQSETNEHLQQLVDRLNEIA